MKFLKYLSLALFYVCAIAAPSFLAFAQGTPGETPRLPNPLANNITNLTDFVQAVLTNIVLPIGAVIVVFFIIYSGYLFVTAGGNEKKIETAKHTFTWVVIGAAVLLGSWAIAAAIEGTLCQIAPTALGC